MYFSEIPNITSRSVLHCQRNIFHCWLPGYHAFVNFAKKNLLNLIRCPLDVETSDAAAWIKTLESI